MCTFNFIPNFQRRPPSPVQRIFSRHTIPLGNLWFFGRKSRSILGGFFSRNLYEVVLIIPSATFRSVWVPDYRQKKVSRWASTPYFNKLLPSIFRQVRQQERAILASTYYTGCVHSISFPNFNVARRRQFGEFFSPYYTLRKFVIFGRKSRSILGGFFFQKSVLGSPDNTLSNF